MSCIETETAVSSSGPSDDGSLRQRKKARLADAFEPTKTRPRKVCRRHSYAFRCTDSDLYEDGEDDKHYESVLLVRVCNPHSIHYGR